MSSFTSFFRSQLIAAIQHEYKNNESKDIILSEVQSLISECSEWLEGKIEDTLTDDLINESK